MNEIEAVEVGETEETVRPKTNKKQGTKPLVLYTS